MRPGGIALAVHVVGLPILILATGQGDLGDPETAASVTFMSITPTQPVPEEEPLPPPELVEPPRPELLELEIPEPEEIIPVPEPMGFQELQLGEEIDSLPPVDSSAAPVDARDYLGRGAAGGRHDGVDAPPGEGALAEPSIPLDVSEVAVLPQLANRDEVARLLLDRFPPTLRAAGVSGQVNVAFVLDSLGRVDEQSIVVIDATHQAFVQPTLDILLQCRFSPAQVGPPDRRQAVAVFIQLPITWTYQGPGR